MLSAQVSLTLFLLSRCTNMVSFILTLLPCVDTPQTRQILWDVVKNAAIFAGSVLLFRSGAVRLFSTIYLAQPRVHISLTVAIRVYGVNIMYVVV